MKLCSFSYVPPPRITGATAFYENIRRFKTTHPLILFSEHPWPEINIPLKISPEVPFAAGKPHKFAINNVLWFTALQLAMRDGYTHMLYLESDCRVGCDGWDGKMFDEYFDIGRPLVAGGSLGVYNPANWNSRAHKKWEELVVTNAEKWQKKPYAQCRLNLPIPTYGWKSAAEQQLPCVFPNGALAIYNIAWMHELFDLTQPATKQAMNPAPFDMECGRRAAEKFGEDVYEVMGHLTSSFSSYADIITTPDERKELLTSGRVCAVHQIKDEWKP